MGGMASAQTGRWISELSSWGARSFIPPETGVGELRFQFCFSTEVCGAAVVWSLCGLSSPGKLRRKKPVRRTTAPFAEADVGIGHVLSSPSSAVCSTFIFPQQSPWHVWVACLVDGTDLHFQRVEHYLRDCPQPEVATHVCSQLQWGKGKLPGGHLGSKYIISCPRCVETASSC